MLSNFRTFQLAVQLYRSVSSVRYPAHIRSQILRSSSSVAANLAEGYGKSSRADQARYYEIAYGSCKETQAFLLIAGMSDSPAGVLADQTGASLYGLIAACRR